LELVLRHLSLRLAVGASFAIQGPVSNYGAGFIIIVTRMFKVGDIISVQGCSGLVKEIALTTTQLVAEDGEDIVIPNKHVVGEIHRNPYQYRVVEGSIGVAYSEDPDIAISMIKQVIVEFPAVSVEPVPQVGIEAFGDSSIVIAYRFWVPTRTFVEAQSVVNRRVFKALNDVSVPIPLPQREVRVLSD